MHDHALEDAIKPSLTGHISKGIALCRQGLVREVKIAFDIASVAMSQDSTNIHFIHLIKAIALINANQCKEAMLLIQELAAIYPNTNTLTRRVVEAYLHVELRTKALGDVHHDDATDHFTATVN
ncbi:hypothetical protein CY34DRAFT_14532 [Suillus luteus UH-Slu-Lm8-n1]|uniref:Anaphase-promoting complex subunit 5 n=1 Tax=Suillus luteus UH-Slu-Lm8-n1 TaxID=930992 RepID=A0A0D0ABR2_9AGAM|nr:hypothetical protein CY34DRAFT_14532 [Suillus luteus UH-Slu-Lm8-n1]